MKKELRRHHEDAGTALEILYGIVGAKTVVSWSPIYLLGLDIEREKTTVFDGTEFTFRGPKLHKGMGRRHSHLAPQVKLALAKCNGSCYDFH